MTRLYTVVWDGERAQESCFVSHFRNKGRTLHELITEACINVFPLNRKKRSLIYLSDVVNHLLVFSQYVFLFCFVFLLFFSCCFIEKSLEVKYQGGKGSEEVLCRWDSGGFQGVLLFFTEAEVLCFVGSSCHWSVDLMSSAFSQQVICRQTERGEHWKERGGEKRKKKGEAIKTG